MFGKGQGKLIYIHLLIELSIPTNFQAKGCNNFQRIHHCHIFMPPTSKKLRRHIGLGLSVRYVCTRSRTVRERILNFGMWDEYEN